MEKCGEDEGVTLGRSLSESVLPNLPSWSVRGRDTTKEGGREEFELESGANRLGADELRDEEVDGGWMTVFVRGSS